MKPFFRLTLAFLAATASLAQHNPLKDPNICGRPTCKGSGKFKYDPGTQQNYKYSVDARSFFNGTSKNESSLYVEGTATVDFLTTCDGLLTLSDLKLSEKVVEDGEERPTGPNSDEFSQMISEHSVRFAFHDGIISEICPAEEEQNWVLNFKRGLLSMLHNTMKRLDLDHSATEEDVRGKCPTVYTVKGAKETSLIIEKSKDLTSCQNRAKLHSIVQSVPYNFRSELQGEKSLLRSSSKCELSIDHNIYNAITCQESHVFQPFSNQDAGATTIVTQRLLLLSELSEPLGEQPEIARRTSLLFDHAPSAKPSTDELRQARNLIKAMCKQSDDDVQTHFSDLFTKFIQTLRTFSHTALTALFRHATTTCPTGKKHLLDALPYVGTTPSVQVMTDIILDKGIPENTAKEWLMTVSFISGPDEEMIEALANVLQEKPFDSSTILSVTSLAHSYCSQHSDCLLNDQILKVVNHLGDIITSLYENKLFDRESKDKMIVSLKSLGNIGVIPDDIRSCLYSIIEDSQIDGAIRVAAVEAYRRLPCTESRDYFESLFRNEGEDVEVRIASYLQIMRCPNYLMIRTIRHSLEMEEVNQVGSFVWSHLNSLMKSSIPSRVEIQGLLSDMDLVKKFSSDVRKFSHHREGSLYFEEYDVGANYDGNVIFSPSSYVPKTAMFNLTVDMFGESINLMEVYGRVEGLEHYLESMFGPKRPLNSAKVWEKVSKMRWGRSTADNEILQSEIDRLPNVIEKSRGEPKVSLGLKVFGNDLKYATFDGDAEIKAALAALNPVDHFTRILSGKEINYNKATMFLDSSYVIPSGAGLPISLKALGTASINVKLLGSLKASNFAETKELDLKADIRPSVALDLTGAMSVDGFFATAGIKLKSSVYTSSAIEGNLKVRGSKLVSVKFSIPRQTSEIFGAKSELIVMKHDVEQVQSGLSERRVSKSICSWPAVDQTVGLKLCGEYHFMNVTKINSAPYFVLAGPVGIRLFMEKSDPTAKIYLFEYKLSDARDLSVASFTFDTPGSKLRRLLSANFTIDRNSQNLTLFLQSSAGTVLAKGRYKNTPENKDLQLVLNINEKRHFDCNLSLIRSDSRHGFTYLPKMYLGINGKLVVQLEGTLKLVGKGGISQYDVDLKFRTKRLTSTLFGYISRGQATLATNLKLDYKFALTKQQRVMLTFSIGDRSHKNIANIQGNCILFSTSYPNFNFEANFSFMNANGHVDSKFDLTASPLPANHTDVELHKLKLLWVLSLKTDRTWTINTVLSAKRQSTNVDFRAKFAYENRPPNIDALISVRYGVDKEVSVSVFWYHPRTPLQIMEGRINITVPSFTSMILQGKLQEKVASDYIVELGGTWFTGHNAALRGVYQYKTSPQWLNHHLKMILRSPSFDDVNADLLFYRDNNEIKIDLKAQQLSDNYALYLKHQVASPEQTTTETKLIYKGKLYSMSSSVYLGDHRQVSVEFHIDQIRDIHFTAWEYNKETYKAAGLEVKWDANRDNNQKLAVSANVTKLGSFNYEGNLLLSYPGRTVLANFDFHLENHHFTTLARLSWADRQTFAINLEIDYDLREQTYISIQSLVATPFDGWQRTTLNGGYHHIANMHRINGTIFWKHDEHVTLDLYKNYSLSDTAFECRLKSSLTSTLRHIPTLSAIVNHNQNTSRVDTALRLMYDPNQMIDIKSNWSTDRRDEYTNVTGTITATTPFNLCKRGYLISKVHYTKTKYVRVYSDLDLDHKKFTLSLEGKVQRIMNSMVVVNISTPIEKYKLINGRFGICEDRRHIVSLITYPEGILGVELLFDATNFTNFDTIFTLGTPITFLEEVILVGKLKSEKADFRIGWNRMVLGFSGVWHYVNVIDFEYSYKIYTPIGGFEENGIVAKLIFKEGLDFEVSIRLSEHKLGVAVAGCPKPGILKELGIKTEAIYGRRPTDPSWSENEDDDYVEDEEYKDPLKWTGSIEIDAMIYPTMQGTLDIDQEGSLYIFQSELSLPDGNATITDEFQFNDVLNMKNDLKIITPYDTFQVISSSYNLEIIPGQKYELLFDVDYQNRSSWIKTGIFALCTIYLDGVKEERYNITAQLQSPLERFPKLILQASHNREINVYKTNLSVTTNSSDISVGTIAEVFKGLFKADVLLKAKTPSFEIPPANMMFKKDFQQDDNLLEARINIEKLLQKEIYFRTNWLYRSLKQFHTFIQLETPYKGMESALAGIKMSVTDKGAEAWSTLRLHPLEIDVNSTLTGNVFRATSNINFAGKEFPILLTGNIQQSSLNRKQFVGDLILKKEQFKVLGYTELLGQLPIGVEISLTPLDTSHPPLHFEYNLKCLEDGSTYVLVGSVQHAKEFTKFGVNATSRHKFDWQLDMQIDTSHQLYNKFIVQANATSTSTESSLTIDAHTLIPKLENPKLGASVTTLGDHRLGKAYFELTQSRGNIQVDWVYLFLENMYIKAVGYYQNTQYASQSQLEAFYINPNQTFQFIKAGGDVQLDRLWSAGSNLTLSLPNYRNMSVEAHLQLPAPIKEVHSLAGKLRYDKNLMAIEYLGKYRTSVSQKKYGSWGNVSLADKTRMGGNVELEWNSKRINNYLDLCRSQNTWNILYKLRTPKFPDKETLVTEMSYTASGLYHNVTCEAFYPEKRSIAFATVDFQELANMNGTVNVTIPFRNVNYTGAHFTTKTNARLYDRYLEIFWPNNSAILDCKSLTLESTPLDSQTTGALVLEVPLTTRHKGNITFAYKKGPKESIGNANVDYNGKKVLEGKYKCVSESREGFDKDRIHVEVQNELVPIGADYVHGYEYEASRDGYSAPTVDKKQVHVYHLKNLTKFNITGEMSVRTNSTGRQVALAATHSNRTVRLWTDYDVLEHQFGQHSRLELSPSSWIEYHLGLLNRSEGSQQVQLDVAYPRRNFTAKGAYNVSETALSSDISLTWDKDTKTVQAGLDWKRAAAQHREEVQLTIKHPSFEKDVSFLGEYEYNDRKLLDASLTVDYSLNPEQTFTVGARLDDHSLHPSYNYSYNVWAVHGATNLNLKSHGGFYWKPHRKSTGHYTDYKRSYLPLQTTEVSALVDLAENIIEMKKRTGHALTYFQTRYGGRYPTYTANISSAHAMNNASGEFYLNFKEKLVQLDFNMTTDGSQSLHMYGIVPDARSAMFDIWRDYEDIRVSDVAYYLRLNHSRLIMSSLLWRPDLKQDIQNGIRSGVIQLYSDVLEGINNTKQYVRSETNEAIHEVWYDAKPLIAHFLDDLRNLRVIEQDFEELKKFLNHSYHANEFHIKDFVDFTTLLFDELALKSHLENLPTIVTEIWDIMGESGTKIKKSIIWFVEKVKTYYKKTAEFIRGLLDGDPIDHLSDAFKGIVERYDAFIKDLHVAFIQYMERLWTQTYTLIVNNWHKALAAIEPTFLTLIHYLETIVWNTSKQFLDFLYIRKSELIESPYFVKFTNFTHDLDRFYKDMTGNNTIAGIVKYTKIVWNFLKEKYFNMVPFGKELQEIVSEILAELDELRNLPSIRYLTEKCEEVYSNIKWVYDYFDMDIRLHRFITLIHLKLSDMSQTALQSDNRYRVAKTKFIFEPYDGVMLLEQKLPMSWHAFNETPKFEEIPELQTIYNIQKYLTTTRTSFWDLYYDYKPYTELSGWLPPFKAQALLVGSRYYMTFDQRYYEFRGSCSYLLATDYVDRNFSIAVSYDNSAKTHELLLLINNTLVHIDVFTDTVRVGDGSRLPVQIGDTTVHHEKEVVTVRSASGFLLECNMKFDVCVFEVSGWYFGKTAGLWGTINNEASDDFLTAHGKKAGEAELDEFTASWTLGKECNSGSNNNFTRVTPNNIKLLCDEFFVSKLSQLTTCFPKVSKDPFLWMCLNSTNEIEACSSAIAYMTSCAFSNTLLRIPDVCVKCNSPSGTQLNEGQYLRLEGSNLPRSADVVFIVEAKECNRNLRGRKNMDTVIALLEKELKAVNVTHNRYSVVAFGGDDSLNEAHSLVVNSKAFANFRQIMPYFDAISIGNGSSDIFEAITFANELLFRAGVSRNFILMPCSECRESNMKLDYAIPHQLLLESDITLHILMNEEFAHLKNKIPFGIDRTNAYTNKDTHKLIGDPILRKHVILPKANLGDCMALAFETNGTVFSSRALGEAGKVFAKRVAASAPPQRCVQCECTATNTGVSAMECTVCSQRSNADFSSMDEDEALLSMQPMEFLFHT